MTAHRLPRLLLPGLLALTLAAGACTSDDPGADGPSSSVDLDSNEISLTSGLETYQSCDALLARLKEEALERVGPYGFQQGGWAWPMFAEGDVATEEMAESEASGAPATTTAAAADSSFVASEGGDSSGGGFTGTNNQEAGVDEADLVKTDGSRLVLVTANMMRVVDLATNTITKEIDLGAENYGGELFLVGDKALLMTQGWTDMSLRGDSIMLPYGTSTTKIIEVDLVAGTVGRTLEFEGNYLSARDIDGSIRVVLWAGVGNLPFLFPSNPGSEDRATENNKAVIEESTIDQWLPAFRVTEGGASVESGSLVECDSMMVPSEFSGFGALSVLTFDGNNGLGRTDSMGILSDGQTVYASTDRLAVATARWPEYDDEGMPVEDASFSTLIHSFDITDPASTRYVASGEVVGHMLSQYSLSEHNGYLRVATTAGDPWWGSQDTSESFITVLAENGATLETVGKVGGIGEGEQIQSVRFMGDRAFVVTFRQIDPLYAIDLADPANPRVLGELKIPGFSAYLHPLPDGMLLGVGQGGTEEGQLTGSQVSVFDVNDPTNPILVSALGLGEQAYSTVEWDARAFTWWAETNTALVPISWYRYDEETGTDESGSATVVVDVAADKTLVERGRITMPSTRQCDTPVPQPLPAEDGSTDAEAPVTTVVGDGTDTAIAPYEPYCWTWTPEVRRNVIANGSIYTISEGGIMVSDLTTLGQITWLGFDA